MTQNIQYVHTCSICIVHTKYMYIDIQYIQNICTYRIHVHTEYMYIDVQYIQYMYST